MRWLYLCAALALCLCVSVWMRGCADYGDCLEGHNYEYWQPIYITTCDSKGFCTMQVAGGYIATAFACDRYQYPDGDGPKDSRSKS